MLIWTNKMENLTGRIIKDREALKNSKMLWNLTLGYCKQEYVAFTIYTICLATTFFTLMVFGAIFQRTNLPYGFYIVFLPFDNLLLKWLINYIFHLTLGTFSSGILWSYYQLTLLLMNQSCWHFDVLIAEIEEFNLNLKLNPKDFKVSRALKAIVETSCKAMEWRNEVQQLLKFNFLVEFVVVALVLCMSL